MLHLSHIVISEVVNKFNLIFDCLVLCRRYHCTYLYFVKCTPHDSVWKMLMLSGIALRMQVSK